MKGWGQVFTVDLGDEVGLRRYMARPLRIQFEGEGMRQLNGLYTIRFNKRHGCVGHVFQEGIRPFLFRKRVIYWREGEER
jgi:hypothetical protein